MALITCTQCGTQYNQIATYCSRCGNMMPGFGTGMLPQNTLLQNRYSVIATVGKGGFGAVYQVIDQRLNKILAIKEMSDAAIQDPANKKKAVAAFLQEKQLLVSLRHPNIPHVDDYFAEGNKHYIVMEFVPGETLQDRIDNHPGLCSEQEVLLWADQLCEVLIYLHSQNPPVIFRDLKPANIILTPEGQIKLIDFGIARLFKPDRPLDTEPLGTPGFAAPEQFGKKQTDARSDIYSFGAVLHYLLTGYDSSSNPFNLPPVRQLRASISRQLEEVIKRATQMDMAQRYQRVSDMKQALSVMRVSPVAPQPPWQNSPLNVPPPPSPSRSMPVWAVITLLVMILAVAGGVFAFSRPQWRDSSIGSSVAVLTPFVLASPTPISTLAVTQLPEAKIITENADPLPIAKPAVTPTKPVPSNTPTPNWAQQKQAIINVVDYYGSEVKTLATTYLNPSSLGDVLIEPALERQRQSVCWLQNQQNYYSYANRTFRVDSVNFENATHATLLAHVSEDRALRKQDGSVVKNYGHESYQAIYQLQYLDGRWYIYCFQALFNGDPVRCEVIVKTPSPCK